MASWPSDDADPPIRVNDCSTHMAQSGFHGQKFRELLRLRSTPSSLITRSVRGVEVAATETRDDNPVPGICCAIVPEDAYIVSLKFRDYPDCEYW
jgi:hypothetical protein